MRKEVSQAPEVRTLLAEAAEALEGPRQSLFQAEPNYAASLEGSLRATRQAFQALITWHSLALPRDVPLQALTRRALPLASMLRTCAGRALLLEPLADELLAQCDCSRVGNQESVRGGYYTARNTFYTVFDELPDVLRPTPPIPRTEAFAH